MTHTHPEAAEYAAAERELQRLAGNAASCDACGGSGRGMAMVCYGGPPQEIEVDCEECGGTGEASA